MIAEHLSTWAEEWILWSTHGVQFSEAAAGVLHRLVDHAAEGQSRCARTHSRQNGPRCRQPCKPCWSYSKDLPLAYNRDLQEDKEPLFDAFDTVDAALSLAAPLIAQAELNLPAIAERLDRGHLDATAFMEYLIGRGIPQRTAHGLVGRLVRTAMDRGLRLADLPLAEFQAASPDLDATVYDVLGVEKAVSAMKSYGSTAPEQVQMQVTRWKERLDCRLMLWNWWRVDKHPPLAASHGIANNVSIG